MCSMNKKNLESCFQGMLKLNIFKNAKEIKKISLFNQNFHIPYGETEFVRDFQRIMDYESIKPSQLVCIESDIEKNKIVKLDGVQYDKLAIDFRVFEENYYGLDKENHTAIDLKVEKLSEYLLKLVDDCVVDVREYLKENNFK